MAKTKQLPAGKSKAAKLKAAAKRKAAASKASAKKKKSSPALPSMASAPESATAPVSSPTGSLISPETWESDQARLQSAAEDADTVDELNAQESEADAEYTSRITAATKAAAERRLELDKQKNEFEKSKAQDYKGLNSTMAYRGASRSSAAARGLSNVATQHTNVANEFKNEAAKTENYVKDVATAASTARELKKGYVAKRRGTLANRAASKGVYSVGSAPGNGGVSAPTIAAPAPKATASNKKAATKRAAAAKRRIAKKKGKK